ncbi:hypothetical protein STEG23_030508, partial [Scotinomys teguina]
KDCIPWNDATHVRLSLPSSVHSLWKCPDRQTQRCISYGIPNPVKLTMINYGVN